MLLPSFIYNVQGKNDHKHYVYSFFIILFSYVIVGTFLYTVVTSFILSPSSAVSFGLSHLFNICWIAGLWISVAKIHKRPFLTLITNERAFCWHFFYRSFFAVFFLLFLSQFISFSLFPHFYILQHIEWTRFLFFALLSISLVPLQVLSEELFFRGFLLQWWGKVCFSPLLLAICSGLFFGSLHFMNPEMNVSFFLVGFQYVFVGFILSYITVKANRSELAIGAHTANNLFIALFLGDAHSVHGLLPSLFIVEDENAFWSLCLTMFVFLSFYLFCSRYFNKKRAA
ncbi:lysostaphin resistance A-like protein [Priestia endophytica]|uniref:CPBP family intramembrane glutamic endopeptidase n=1 Tax=Priestia filamentosa TaxID=1402861 RepID=UPI002E224062|nr:type II CAAX endopeptidase family protein [Priestia filamentosa]